MHFYRHIFEKCLVHLYSAPPCQYFLEPPFTFSYNYICKFFGVRFYQLCTPRERTVCPFVFAKSLKSSWMESINEHQFLCPPKIHSQSMMQPLPCFTVQIICLQFWSHLIHLQCVPLHDFKLELWLWSVKKARLILAVPIHSLHDKFKPFPSKCKASDIVL
ncbi:hypothetical protein GOODEAATRI_014875 [Goodea atripinnis]|uniref:Maturase K n=1 Tax=Goodea atripinnis TaxID=208336 RepID=A0ABV0PE90_9TELE